MKLTTQLDFFSHVSMQEKLLFTKHLSVMLRSGIPILEALSILIEQTTSPSFRRTLERVFKHIKNGKSLSDAIELSGKTFDQFFISIIGVGEESGTLEQSLDFLSDQLQKDYQLKKKVQGAMLYPTIVFTLVIILGGFIALFILPQLVTFFEAFDTKLPLTTQILLTTANFFKNHGILFFICLGVFIALWSLFIKTKTVKPLWQKMLYAFPLFGKLLTYNQTVRFCRNLGILLKSGVPITAALETTKNTLSSVHYIRAVSYVLQEVKRGKSIDKALTDNRHVRFQPIVVKMIGVGEKTGKLEESLIYLADFYEQEVDGITKNLSTILEPVLLIFIGLAVGFIALAIISPIYELTGSIRSR